MKDIKEDFYNQRKFEPDSKFDPPTISYPQNQTGAMRAPGTQEKAEAAVPYYVRYMATLDEMITEKLCKKGEAYRKRRMAAGEKSSAYLSGRAVKVCNGTMSGKKKKTNEQIIQDSLRDWFKKENWVRINTSGNISGDCGTMKKGKATTRCLPKKKAQSLTKAERKATVAKKVRGSKKGKQFVKNTKKAEFKKK